MCWYGWEWDINTSSITPIFINFIRPFAAHFSFGVLPRLSRDRKYFYMMIIWWFTHFCWGQALVYLKPYYRELRLPKYEITRMTISCLTETNKQVSSCWNKKYRYLIIDVKMERKNKHLMVHFSSLRCDRKHQRRQVREDVLLHVSLRINPVETSVVEVDNLPISDSGCDLRLPHSTFKLNRRCCSI